MDKEKTLHPDAVELAAKGGQRFNIGIAEIFRQVGLRFDRQNSFQRLPSSEAARLMLATVDALQDETLGFLKRRTRPGGIETACHAIISSANLREATGRWQAFWQLIHDDLQARLTEDDFAARITLKVEGPESSNSVAFVSLIFLLQLRLSRWLTGKALILDELNLAYPEPSFAEDYQDVFPCPHYFDQTENSLIFHKRFLDLPITQTAASIPQFMQLVPALMTTKAIDESASGRIKNLLLSGESYEPLSFRTVAATLKRSEDSIRRALKSEGVTFAEIKESVRKDLAVFHLRRAEKSVSEIGYLLGFSEPSAFNRAFKNWTGKTPGAYREAFILT